MIKQLEKEVFKKLLTCVAYTSQAAEQYIEPHLAVFEEAKVIAREPAAVNFEKERKRCVRVPNMYRRGAAPRSSDNDLALC